MLILKSIRRQEKRDTTLQMAPMIDCVFLLLIFFMVSAVMRIPPPFSVNLPESETKHEFPRKKYNVFISQNGDISIDNHAVDLDSLGQFLGEHQHQISSLIVKADRYATHGIIIDVMERAKQHLNKAEGQEIALAVSED